MHDHHMNVTMTIYIVYSDVYLTCLRIFSKQNIWNFWKVNCRDGLLYV